MVPVRQASGRLSYRRFGALSLVATTLGAALTACSDEADAATDALNGFLAHW